MTLSVTADVEQLERTPVEGLVASLNQPGGNLMGVNFFTTELVANSMQLLRQGGPSASRIGVLVNPTDTEDYADNWMTVSKTLSSAANQNPCISEAFLVRKWLYPLTKLRIKRIDKDVICQQTLNNGAAMLIVG
jgi:hypothetical protein